MRRLAALRILPARPWRDNLPKLFQPGAGPEAHGSVWPILVEFRTPSAGWFKSIRKLGRSAAKGAQEHLPQAGWKPDLRKGPHVVGRTRRWLRGYHKALG